MYYTIWPGVLVRVFSPLGSLLRGRGSSTLGCCAAVLVRLTHHRPLNGQHDFWLLRDCGAVDKEKHRRLLLQGESASKACKFDSGSPFGSPGRKTEAAECLKEASLSL